MAAFTWQGHCTPVIWWDIHPNSVNTEPRALKCSTKTDCATPDAYASWDVVCCGFFKSAGSGAHHRAYMGDLNESYLPRPSLRCESKRSNPGPCIQRNFSCQTHCPCDGSIPQLSVHFKCVEHKAANTGFMQVHVCSTLVISWYPFSIYYILISRKQNFQTFSDILNHSNNFWKEGQDNSRNSRTFNQTKKIICAVAAWDFIQNLITASIQLSATMHQIALPTALFILTNWLYSSCLGAW